MSAARFRAWSVGALGIAFARYVKMIPPNRETGIRLLSSAAPPRNVHGQSNDLDRYAPRCAEFCTRCAPHNGPQARGARRSRGPRGARLRRGVERDTGNQPRAPWGHQGAGPLGWFSTNARRRNNDLTTWNHDLCGGVRYGGGARGPGHDDDEGVRHAGVTTEQITGEVVLVDNRTSCSPECSRAVNTGCSTSNLPSSS